MFFKHILSLKVLIALLLFFGMISLFIGVISINVKDILNLNSTQLEIITLTRIPRLIAILLTGMSLSICGLIMQQLTQNKFVSPTTAGTMDCAKFGILISLIFFLEHLFSLKLPLLLYLHFWVLLYLSKF